MVHHPARGAHHDLNTTLELVNLVSEVGAAVNRQGAHAAQVGGIAVKGIGHLQGQLPGGGEHQHLGLALGWIEGGQHRQREGRGFAGACLGLAHQVAAEQQLGDGGFLDRRGLLVADGVQGLQQLGAEAKAGKALAGFRLHRRRLHRGRLHRGRNSRDGGLDRLVVGRVDAGLYGRFRRRLYRRIDFDGAGETAAVGLFGHWIQFGLVKQNLVKSWLVESFNAGRQKPNGGKTD